MNARSFAASRTAVRMPGLGSAVLKSLHDSIGMVQATAKALLNRSMARKLTELSDRELADIGLTRDDVRNGFSVPLSADPTVELARRARLNSYS